MSADLPLKLLLALGVNDTVFIQFCLFLVTYLFLYFVLFKPYFKAFVERKKRTEGNENTTERIVAETKDLYTTFETKARTINAEYKTIFDQSRTEAIREYDKVVGQARSKAQQILEDARTRINDAAGKARRDLAQEVPAVSQAIVSRLVGKDAGT